MIEAIRKEVRRLCNRNAIVSHILAEDQAAEYKDDYKRLLTTQEAERESTVATKLSFRRERTISRGSESSQRGWDPILAGYQAREIMSRAPTPGELHMERSLLPMDLNSASSENSSVHETDDWSEGEGHSTGDWSEGEGYGLDGVPLEDEEEEELRESGVIVGNGNLENDEKENISSRNSAGTPGALDLDPAGLSVEGQNSPVQRNQSDCRENVEASNVESAQVEEELEEHGSNIDEPELLNLAEEDDSQQTRSNSHPGSLVSSAGRSAEPSAS